MPTGPGDGAGGDLELGHGEPFPVARELGVMTGQFETEGRRLGVDAVAAAHGRRHLVLERTTLQRGEDELDVVHQQVRRPAES